MNWLTAYLVVINIVSFAAMLIDKKRAMNYQWRIPEKTLFALAIIGGERRVHHWHVACAA